MGILLFRFNISYPLAHTIVLAFKTVPRSSIISLSPSLFVNIFFTLNFGKKLVSFTKFFINLILSTIPEDFICKQLLSFNASIL